jgi:excisionase family DNA binding protein
VQTVQTRFTLCIVRGVPVARHATSIEVGVALGVSAATVARYARQGRLPFSTTPGGHRRFNIDEVRVALGRQAPVRVAAISTATAANRPRVRLGDAQPIGVSTAAFRREALRATFTPVDTTVFRPGCDPLSLAEPVESIIGSARCVLVGAPPHPSQV